MMGCGGIPTLTPPEERLKALGWSIDQTDCTQILQYGVVHMAFLEKLTDKEAWRWIEGHELGYRIGKSHGALDRAGEIKRVLGI